MKAKIEKRGGLIVDMENIRKKAVDEKRDLTAEELIQWNKLDDEQEGLRKQIEVQRKQDDLNREQETRRENVILETGADPQKNAEAESRAFRDYILRGRDHMDPKNREVLEKRAQTTTTTAGGYLIPEGFQNELEKAMLPFITMYPFARVIKTNEGNDIQWPMVNDTANKGELMSEGGGLNSQDVAFTRETLKAYMFDSKIVQVSLQLLQDSAIPIETLLGELLGERVGRILNQYFTTGTGTAQPEGVAGTLGATSSAVTGVLIAGPDRDDIVKLVHSVNADYRRNGTFMFNDSILKAIKLMVVGTTDANPLWRPGLLSTGGMSTREPDTIEGYPYIINDEMASLGSGNKIMLFGDFKKFIIREVTGFIMVRLNELYMANLNVGFVGYKRASSHLLDAGTHPIKYLACGTT